MPPTLSYPYSLILTLQALIRNCSVKKDPAYYPDRQPPGRAVDIPVLSYNKAKIPGPTHCQDSAPQYSWKNDLIVSWFLVQFSASINKILAFCAENL